MTPQKTNLVPLLMLVGSLGTILVVAVWMAIGVISDMGDISMSGHGWTAMAIGVVLTVGLGGILMALVFYSSRRGYDEAPTSDDGHGELH
ncbi:MAG TPA: hypothetical protein VIR38_01470 [Thalassobaculum sp.]